MRLSSLLCLGFFAFSAACATSSSSGSGQTADPNAPPSDDPAASTNTPDDPADAPPHALGSITLGEARTSSVGDSAPVISAAFLPDAKLEKSCTHKVGACDMTDVPKCTTGAKDGCNVGETCTVDDTCAAKCVKACTKACGAAEECFFSADAPTQDNGMACRKRARFDAGAIAFDGTTTSVTLFPPYSVKPEGNGAPFMAQSKIRVQASGASSAGFEKFDETYTSTTFLETNPPLSDLGRSAVFGTDDVAIGWVAGEDSVYVTVSGAAGSARCAADDTTGSFKLPRSVIQAVSGASGTPSNLAITVSRERREVRKDKKTMGTLGDGVSVQPVGWLELITTSSETETYQSCNVGQAICNDQCVNTQSDPANCGGCGKACLTGQYCTSGLCH